MGTDSTYDVERLKAKPVLNSIEASFLISGQVLSDQQARWRMGHFYRRGMIERVDGIKPYVWKTPSVLAMLEVADSKPARRSRKAVQA